MLWSRDRSYGLRPKMPEITQEQRIKALESSKQALQEYCDNLEERIQLLEDSFVEAGIHLKQPS